MPKDHELKWWHSHARLRVVVNIASDGNMSNPLIGCVYHAVLTHWGRVTHICVSKLTTIGYDNGLSPGRRQAIIWTNDGILLIGPLRTYFSEILIEIHTFSFMKMHFKLSSERWRPFCLGLNVIRMCLISWMNNIGINASENVATAALFMEFLNTG